MSNSAIVYLTQPLRGHSIHIRAEHVVGGLSVLMTDAIKTQSPNGYKFKFDRTSGQVLRVNGESHTATFKDEFRLERGGLQVAVFHWLDGGALNVEVSDTRATNQPSVHIVDRKPLTLEYVGVIVERGSPSIAIDYCGDESETSSFVGRKWVLGAEDGASGSMAESREDLLIPVLDAATLCMWVKSSELSHTRAIVTYGNLSQPYLQLRRLDNIEISFFSVTGAKSGISLDDAQWHCICTLLQYQYPYFDLTLVKDSNEESYFNWLRTSGIPAGQQFRIGDEVDTNLMEGNDTGIHLQITEFNVWSVILSPQQIETINIHCFGSDVYGDIVSWAWFGPDDLHGIVVEDLEESLCVGTCRWPRDMDFPNGIMDGDNANGSVLTFTCDAGLRMVGPESWTCSGGLWLDDRVPKCFNVSAHYTLLEEPVASRDAVSKCQERGETLVEIHNEEILNYLTALLKYRGRSDLIGYWINVNIDVYGQRMSFDGCTYDFREVTPEVSQCIILQASGAVIFWCDIQADIGVICQKKDACHDDPGIDNGTYICEYREDGRYFQYNCDDRHVLLGNGTRQCINGHWFGEQPTCIKHDHPIPVAFWPLDKNAKLKDASGNSNHGVNGGGAILVPDAKGTLAGAYQFTGSAGSYVEFPNDGAYDTRYSIHMLMYIYPQGTFGPTFNFKRDGWRVHTFGGNTGHYAMFIERNRLTHTITLYVEILQENNWNFIGASYNYNTGTGKLWVMDQVVASANIGIIELATNYEARMGKQEADGRFLEAMISCMQVYDRELSQLEILEAESMCKIVPVMTTLAPTFGSNESTGFEATTVNATRSTTDDVKESCTVASSGHVRILYENGATLNFGCAQGYHMIGRSTSSCVDGEWNSPIPLCEDIDECIEFEKACDSLIEHRTCNNVMGNYECVCMEGYYAAEDDDNQECRPKPVVQPANCDITVGNKGRRCAQEEILIGNSTIIWPETVADCLTEWMPCPPGSIGNMRRFCRPNGSWNEPDTIDCKSHAFLDLMENVKNITQVDDAINIMETVNNLTSPDSLSFPADLLLATGVLSETLNKRPLDMPAPFEHHVSFVETTMESISQLLDEEFGDIWHSVSENTNEYDGAADVVLQVNSFGSQIGQFLRQSSNETLEVKTKNVELKAEVFHASDLSDYVFPPYASLNITESNANITLQDHASKQENFIFIPAHAIRKLIGTNTTEERISIVGTLCPNLAKLVDGTFISRKKNKQRQWVKSVTAVDYSDKVNTIGISATIQPVLSEDMESPDVYLRFTHLKNADNPRCAYMDLSAPYGLWNKEGCEIIGPDYSQGYTECVCSKVKSFAVIMDIIPQDFLTSVVTSFVKIAAVGACCLILLTLFFSIIARIPSDTYFALNNLLVTFLCLLSSIPVAMRITENDKSWCKSTALVFHLFSLTCFVWMAILSVSQLALIRNVVWKTRVNKVLYFCVGWFAPPILMATLSFFLQNEIDDTDERCWITWLPYTTKITLTLISVSLVVG
ncbi:uncharacterized protein [Ptychodera flava]|uniref:uncharacterized protein n=1 Tax=Ptychodera flava TaxID=63121 RepID=UPI003969C06F